MTTGRQVEICDHHMYSSFTWCHLSGKWKCMLVYYHSQGALFKTVCHRWCCNSTGLRYRLMTRRNLSSWHLPLWCQSENPQQQPDVQGDFLKSGLWQQPDDFLISELEMRLAERFLKTGKQKGGIVVLIHKVKTA